jgi:hypothetical protein
MHERSVAITNGPQAPARRTDDARQHANAQARGCRRVYCHMSGCASSPNDDTYSLYAEPGRYDYLDCASIAQRMTMASEAADGAIVNAIAIRTSTTPYAQICDRCATLLN